MRFLLLGFAALMGACCHDDEDVLIEGKRTVKFFGNLTELNQNTKTTEGFFVTNDSIGIFMIKAGSQLSSTSILNGVNNYIYKTPRGGVNPEFFPVSTDTIFYPTPVVPSFIAYSPAQVSIGADFLLSADLSTQTNISDLPNLDLIYSDNATNQTSIAVQLRFNHMYSYLNFEINAGAGLTSAELDGISVVVRNISTTADFNLATGGFQNLGAQTDSIVTPGKYYFTNKSAFFECLLLPGANGINSQIVFQLANNKTFVYEIPATQEFLSGYIYTYIVTLSARSAVVNGAINPWLPGTLPNDGVITVP
ncbi:MAG: fimbrillin family protein [Bacteroidales bacterium]